MYTTLLIGVAAGAAGGGLLDWLRQNRNAQKQRKSIPLGGMIFGAAIGVAVVFAFFRPKGTITEIQSKEHFEQVVLKAEKPVVVDFFATWCGPCQMLAPRMEDLANDYRGKVDFVKVDIDKLKSLKNHYDIEGYPTVLIFYKGVEMARIPGLQEKETYKNVIEKILR